MNGVFEGSVSAGVIGILSLAVHLFIGVIVLCSLWLVYMTGLFISSGVSMWRLIQHDYGNTNADATKANLKAALDLLYSVALAQGVLFGYKVSMYCLLKHKVAKEVVDKYMFDELAVTSVKRYVHDTRIGCEKNPSFAEGRNLITYAVGLIISEGSPDNYLDGLRILDTLIAHKCVYSRGFSMWYVNMIIGQNMLIRELLIHSSSSSHIIRKLLLSLDSTSPYDREIRARAARIVAQIADGIHLEQFPRGIHCISSLLDTPEEEQPLLEPFERDWLLRSFGQSVFAHLLILPQPEADNYMEKKEGDGEFLKAYKDLVIQGLHILKKLAADEENCRIINNTPGLLSKIMAPVTSDLLHQFDHGEWSSIVEGSLKVMRQLLTSSGDSGTTLRRKISGNKEAMAVVEGILKCDICKNSYPQLQKQAIKIILEMDASSSMSAGCRENIIKLLVSIFTDEGSLHSFRQFAGEKLATLCLQSSSSAKIVLQANEDVVSNLTNILGQVKSERSIPASDHTDSKYKFERESADRVNRYRISAANCINNYYRTSAARVLKCICIGCSNDDVECLKKVMIDMMHKVIPFQIL